MFKKVFLAAIFTVFIVGCGQIQVGINNMPNSNLNNRGDNVPITVIVYQLSDIKKFEEATEMELITKENEVLGRDKIDSIKLQIQPNANTAIVKIDKENVPYVGVLVLYADQGKTKIKEFKKTSDVKEGYLIFSISDKDIKALSAKSLVVKE
ncbi:type VI secretion lipoprotein, VC_A0113 family [Campylobacter rectus RM3267]|uniref:Type VI secretion system, membrane platform protein n=2 Tax=Campylobacter rectus TaxID=203 RepID=A0A6G5QPX5_CAMRE|nr:type VI secretion system lipoprotein TssJ [Campylobacter rectus]EEF12850.1 type VI secretion lipoprotein, VC_A0113 family [Campylobacter rectus RM3267]QCD47765.1 type VI secretion system, membrane platform protein [Campylobacter rectus]UEB48460.1 type VI secretion system lipoprotein TssJ [Campylobacter rectus]